MRSNSSIAADEQRMGYSPGPVPHRHPGDFDRPGSLIGHPPLVLQPDHRHGWLAKVDDAVGTVSVFIVFVMWVVVPVCGGLALLFR